MKKQYKFRKQYLMFYLKNLFYGKYMLISNIMPVTRSNLDKRMFSSVLHHFSFLTALNDCFVTEDTNWSSFKRDFLPSFSYLSRLYNCTGPLSSYFALHYVPHLFNRRQVWTLGKAKNRTLWLCPYINHDVLSVS